MSAGGFGRVAHETRLMLVAVQYFTRLPVPTLARFDPAWLSQAVRYFPLAGALVGALAAGVLWLASLALPLPLAALLALAAMLAVTGAFHEDGLADTFDALGGHVDRSRALEIMRDSRIGTYGAAALALALLLRWQALAALAALDLIAALALLPCLHAGARAAAASLMAGLPYVRLDDDAKAKPVAQPMGAGRLLATLMIGLLPTLLLALWRPALLPALGAAWLALIVVRLVCVRWFRRRLGGYTGDGLGCAEQFGEIAFALAALAVLRMQVGA